MTLLLLDTNAYLRIAKRVKPLLGVAFGQKGYRLTILEDVEREFERSPRLQSTFPWFQDGTLQSERLAKRFRLSGEDRAQLDAAASVLRGWVIANAGQYRSPPSPVDCRVLAFGQLKEATVVTDDLAMHQLGEEFGIATMHGHELLRRMLAAKMVSKVDVRAIYQALERNGDLPATWIRDRDSLFPRLFCREGDDS